MAKKMTNDDIVRFMDACIQEADKTWSTIRKVQKECYDRYRMWRDFSKKKSWQHKMVVPSVFPAIKHGSELIKRILAKTDEFFLFEAQKDDDPNRNVVHISLATGQPIPPPENKMDNVARAFTKKVRYHVDECKYIDKMAEAIECAFTIGEGCIRFNPKNGWETEIAWEPVGEGVVDEVTGEPIYKFVKKMTERGMLECTTVNPFFLSYPHDKSYIVEQTRVYLHELVDSQDLPLDQKELKKMMRDDYESHPETEQEAVRRKMLGIMDHKNTFRKTVLLHTYWGDLTNAEGEMVMPSCRFIVANKKYVIMKPVASPYWTRKHPYIFITPLKILFSMLGMGMVEGIRPIINALDNLVNIMGDKLLYTLLPPNEINTSMLVDQQQAEGGLIPGKSFKTKGVPGQAIRAVDVGDIPMGGLNFIEVLRKFVQNYTGWTEFMQGMPTSKGQVTATEVERKTQAGSLSFEGIASSIETDAIFNSIQFCRDLTLQYFMDPKYNKEVLDIFEDEGVDLRKLPPSEQFAFINKNYPLKLKGLQAFFDNEKERSDLIQALGVLSTVPAMLGRLNIEEFLTRFFNSFTWDRPELLIMKIDPMKGVLVNPKTGEEIPMELMAAISAMVMGKPPAGPEVSPPGAGGGPENGPIDGASSPDAPQNNMGEPTGAPSSFIPN